MKLIKFLLIAITLISLACVGNIYAVLHDYTGLPMTDDGWTDLQGMFQDSSRYNDSRIIYVSTSGNDNTAIDYSPGNAAIGNDPFNPVGYVSPYATLEAAYARLRNGYPDIMLLKRGDVWTENLPLWNKSGRSNDERMILGAYGSLSISRPKIGVHRTYYGVNDPQDVYDNNIYVSIEFTSFGRSIGGTNMLIEDCSILKGLDSGIVLQGFGENLVNAVIRRSIVAERHPDIANSSHCQGIFAEFTDNLLLEENIFDHNGWASNPMDGGGATIHNHNTYLSVKNDNTVMRYNISTRSSSKGYQPGGGGLIYANLSFQNPIGIESSRDETYKQGIVSTIQSNVILTPDDPKSRSRTNWGIRMCNVGSSLVEDNILAHNPNPISSISIFLNSNERNGEQMSVKNVTIRNNIVYNWDGRIMFDNIPPYMENISFIENRIHEGDAGYGLIVSTPIGSEITSSDNFFYSSESQDRWFNYGGSDITLALWQSTVGDAGSVAGTTTPSRDYTITAYLGSINESTTLDSFYTVLHNQRKGFWDSRYSAIPIINYVRSSFGKDPLTFPYSLTSRALFTTKPSNIHIQN